jgi:hypothetical protein
MTVAGDTQGSGRPWARRLLLVLPLLAADFLMHGVQCGGEDHGTEHTLMALAAPQTGGMAHAPGQPAAADSAGMVHAAFVAGEPVLRNAPGAPQPPLSPAGVCLVLLTAGLVLLLLGLGLRRQPAPDRGSGAPPGAGPPVPTARPPSLAQLCLLRI